MKTVTLILPFETTTVSDSRSDISSDSVATAGETAAERYWSDSGADSRSDSSSDSVATAGATAAATERQKRQQSDSKATAER